MSSLTLYDIRYEIKNAGPSPFNNLRTELYTAGCKKAASGKPCKGCFNQMIWKPENGLKKTPREFLECLNNHSIPKYITIVGGEPTDQLEGVIEFARLAKKDNYHIILFSWHDKEWLENVINKDIHNFDILIPGEYVVEQHIYDESKDDGVHNMIGSGNQMIWIPKYNFCKKAEEVNSMAFVTKSLLEVKLNNGNKHYFRQ